MFCDATAKPYPPQHHNALRTYIIIQPLFSMDSLGLSSIQQSGAWRKPRDPVSLRMGVQRARLPCALQTESYHELDFGPSPGQDSDVVLSPDTRTIVYRTPHLTLRNRRLGVLNTSHS